MKGIGKISDSQIEMKGITVIAGENNTGKSTFGKALYCMFNSFFKADVSIYNERVNNIKRIISSKVPMRRVSMRFSEIVQKIVEKVLSFIDTPFSSVEMRRVIKDNLIDISPETKNLDDQTIDFLVDDIKKSIGLKNDDIQKTIINRYFHDEFEGKINHVNRPDTLGAVLLSIKDKNLKVTISNNECIEFTDEVSILYNAIYIDTPFVVDEIGKFYYSSVGHRDNLLNHLEKDDGENTVIEEALIKQKTSALLKKINLVVGGEFKEEKNDLVFVESMMRQPLPLSSVSAGIKTFLIIKRLLETGEITERGVLILDEPEIHLHPEWQIKFAEILVLLQKEFNLTILLTTHSPYFLHAVEVYGNKHNIVDCCNYYLAEVKGDIADIREVTGKVDEVYKKLAEPFQELEDIVYGAF
jgi:predicted ATP-dependent endonuclease of OLD family